MQTAISYASVLAVGDCNGATALESELFAPSASAKDAAASAGFENFSAMRWISARSTSASAPSANAASTHTFTSAFCSTAVNDEYCSFIHFQVWLLGSARQL